MNREKFFGYVVGVCVVFLFAIMLLPSATGIAMLDWSVVLVLLGLVFALYACIFVQLF